jgi:hypothetical protein
VSEVLLERPINDDDIVRVPGRLCKLRPGGRTPSELRTLPMQKNNIELPQPSAVGERFSLFIVGVYGHLPEVILQVLG